MAHVKAGGAGGPAEVDGPTGVRAVVAHAAKVAQAVGRTRGRERPNRVAQAQARTFAEKSPGF